MPDNNNAVIFPVTVDDSTLEKELQAVNKKVEKSAEQTQKKINEIGKTAETAVKPLTEATEKAADGIEELGEAAEDAANDVVFLGDSAKDTADKTEELGEESEKASKKIKEQGEQSRKSAEHTEKLKDSVDKVKTSVKDAGETIGKYAATAGAAFTAVGTAAIKSAADAETSFAKVKTLLSDKVMIDDYYNSIKAASANTGVDFGNMAESVYSAISASVEESKAVAFTENAVKLAKGGFTETATAVDVLTTAINAYGLAADDASHISDVLITTQNAGKTTVDELARSMGQTIPIANSANVALEELSAAYAVMTKNGVATAEAGTQIKAMLNELNASGTNVDKTLRDISRKSFAELKAEGQTTADVLNTLSAYAAESGQKISDLFGSVEAGAAALTLVKDGGADFANILDQMQNSAGATEKAYDTMADTVEERLNKLKNRFVLSLTDIGEDLMPQVEKFADYIDEHFDEISETIGDIGEATEQAAEFLLGLTKVLWENKQAVGAAVAGYAAFKTAMAIGNVINAVITATRTLTTATQGATIAQEAMNAVCNANPYVLLASAIIGVVGAVAGFEAMAGSAADRASKLSNEVRSLAESARTAADEQQRLADVAAEYEHINDTVTDAAQKKEELTRLQKTLNSLYDGEKSGLDLVNGSYEEQIGLLEQLNEKEKAHRINQVEEELAEARTALNNAQGIQFPLNFKVNENTEDFIFGQLNDIYLRWQSENSDMFTLGNGRDDERNLYIEGNIDDQVRLLEELEQAISDSGLSTTELSEAFEAIGERKKTLAGLRDGVADCEAALDTLNGTADKTSETIEEAAKEFDELNSASESAENIISILQKRQEDLDESAKTLISEYGGLYDALDNLKKGGTLNYEQMQAFLKVYPELSDKIQVTADGYIFEAGALDLLGMALEDSINAQVAAEKAKTEVSIQGAKDRINAINTEMAALARLGEYSKANALKKEADDIRANLTELQNSLTKYDTIPDYVRGTRGKTASVSSGNSSGGSSDGGTKSAVTENENEKAYSAEYNTLKYRHEMGEISDEDYYSGIADLRNKYLEADSDKWRSANLEIHRWEESQKKSSESGTKKSSLGSGSTGTLISIDSYIPTLWDSETEADEKLQKALGLGLAGSSNYAHNISAIQSDISAVGSSVPSTSVQTASAQETTLSDIVSAISDLKNADENKHISLEVELKARNLTIGRVAVADINDITKMNGKSPLIS